METMEDVNIQQNENIWKKQQKKSERKLKMD